MASVCRPVGPGGPALRQPVFCTKAIVTLTTFIRVHPEKDTCVPGEWGMPSCCEWTQEAGEENKGKGHFFFFLKVVSQGP